MTELLPRLPRVEALIGQRLDRFDRATVDQIVLAHTREDTDLDFKEEIYAEADKGHADAATDVAAMANGPGGVVFLGIEDRDGAAVAIKPVTFLETTELRLRQAIIARTAPAPLFVIHRIPIGTEFEGVYLVVVPPSPYAPHAVRTGVRLGYPKRSGPHTRWLSESEVADAYRSRFTAAQERTSRLDLIGSAAHGLLSDQRVWLSTTIVPAVPGSFMIRRRSMNELRDTAAKWLRSTYSAHVFHEHLQVEAASGRIVLRSGRDRATRRTMSGHAECYSDGSVLVATPVAHEDPRWAGENAMFVDNELLTEAAIATIAFSAWFATDHAGAFGDAYARASLIPGRAERTELTHSWSGPGIQFDEGRPTSGVLTSNVSIDLGEAGTARGQLAAARLMLSGIVQAFGLPEVLQITEDLLLRRRYIAQQNRTTVEHWANAHGIGFVNTTIEEEP